MPSESHSPRLPFTEYPVSRPPSDSDQNRFRSLSGASAKSVAIVAARAGRWDHAVPVTDYLSVSYDPPTMLVSLYGLSRIAEAVDAAGEWAISILEAGQRDVVERLHDPGGPLVGLLDRVPHRRVAEGGPAIIEGAVTWFQCLTVARHEAATHVLFVGEVTAMGAANSLRARPLTRVRGELR